MLLQKMFSTALSVSAPSFSWGIYNEHSRLTLST